MSAPRAKELFLELIELAPGQRQAALTRACAGDHALRARVAALLAAHDRAPAVIVEPTAISVPTAAGNPAGRSVPPLLGESAASAIGAVIGPYTIERVLGEGGFGTVYQARQESPVRRLVALKVIRPGMDTRDVIARFEAERQALAVMDHPGIARVFDAGTTPDGRPFFVMECVDGRSITDFCDAERLPIRDRIELFEQVCLAVQHAHAKGVIHRDLKPSNIMVSRVDGRPFAKVIDFGIAKALHHPLVADAAVTLPSQVIGTPMYMAPEQASPESSDVDARADVYSLGVVLYELLTGAPPFEPDRLRKLWLSEIERIIREEDPPRPSARAAALDPAARKRAAASRNLDDSRLARLLEGDLDWIVVRALEKDRNRRYAAPLALAGDLRRYLRDEPVEAGPPTVSYRMAKFARRHRIEFAAAGVVALALIALAVGGVWLAWREHRAAQRTNEELVRANALATFAREMLAGIDPARAQGQDTALVREILDGAGERVGRDLAEHPEAAVSMLNTIGFALTQIGEAERAERVFRRAVTTGREHLGPEAHLTLDAMDNLGSALTALSRFEEAAALFKEVIATRERILGAEHSDTLKPLSNLAFLYDRAGEHAAARITLERLLEVRRRTLGPEHPQTLLTMNNLASALDDLGDVAGAVELIRQVLEVQERTAPEDPRTLATMNNLAEGYRRLDRLDEAIPLYERSLAVKRRVLPSTHPSLITSLVNLGGAYLDMGQLEPAEAALGEAIRLAREAGPAAGLQRIGALNTLSRLHRTKGHPDQALIAIQEAVDAGRETLGQRHPTLVTLMSNLCAAQFEAGLPADAERTARECLALADQVLPAGHPATVLARLTLGRALMARGSTEEARVLLEQLVADEPALNGARPGLADEARAELERARAG